MEPAGTAKARRPFHPIPDSGSISPHGHSTEAWKDDTWATLARACGQLTRRTSPTRKS
ncbi:hypothetical protein [Streptomyces sp. WL006]|uniref:hypothetical protein n=1 Tax=Streptomyces sp. WL006 TaxID=3423915 RepID=UPI003F6B1154